MTTNARRLKQQRSSEKKKGKKQRKDITRDSRRAEKRPQSESTTGVIKKNGNGNGKAFARLIIHAILMFQIPHHPNKLIDKKEQKKWTPTNVCFSCIGEYHFQVSKPTHYVMSARR